MRNGKTSHGKQRYIRRNQECPRCTFILDYTNQGYQPEAKRKIVDMSVNVSGVRDTARVLNISTSTVIKELKKRKSTPIR
ncbi:MAG: IS1-like element transposase [Cyanobacteria bacterium P01_A01_bin.40]